MKNIFWLVLMGLIVAIFAPSSPVHAATPQQIDQAIEKAKAFLYSQQRNGGWDGAPEYHLSATNKGGRELETGDWGGLTAMATHALLAAGENSNDPRLRPAVDLLLKWPMRMCPYALCQRDQVLEMLPRTAAVRAVAWKDGQYLAACRRTKGAAAAMYHYIPGDSDDYDHSVSQYGVLAMWACAQTGFEVPSGYWESTEQAWQRHQDAGGAWSYIFNATDEFGKPTAAMTAAGIATLFITQDYVHSSEGLYPKGNITNPSIDRGMKWLGDHFDQVYAVPSDMNTTYNLYGIERIGVAGGYKYFGTHDWYKEGTAWLLQKQEGNGCWGSTAWGSPVISTSFALFFLTRGREPVAFNKIQYDTMVGGKSELGHWNQRPRDIAKITRWIEKNTEHNLNWHIVNLQTTPADEMLDAPVLYIAGNQALDLKPEEEAKLKYYIENGGLVLGNPDGDSPNFLKSFEKLASKLFPMYEMRQLSPDHPIYMHEQFRGDDIKHKDKLLGLSNGVRELMIIPTNDWGKAWQGDLVAQQDAFRLAGNVYMYATGRTSFRHGGPGVIHPDPALTATTTVKMARLDYAGNADPEPAGWRRVTAILHNQDHIDLQVQTVKLGDGILATVPAGASDAKPSAADLHKAAMKRITPEEFQATDGDAAKLQALINTKISEIQNGAAASTPLTNTPNFMLAHLTGTSHIALTAAQRQEIKSYVQGGGTLLIDAAGGSSTFADSMEKELLAIFPKDAAAIAIPIPKDDPLYAGANIDFNYRRYTREGESHPSGPDLRGLKINGRWAVLLSRQDISNGLVGRDVDGVAGYTPECATALVVNMVKQLNK